LVAKFATFGSESFDTANWVTLPEDIGLSADELLDFFGLSVFWNVLGEVVGEGVRFEAFLVEILDIVLVLLNPLLEMLLGATDVFFTGDLALGLIHHYGVAAFVVVLADSSSTVALEIGKIEGDNITRDFAVEVTLKKFSEVEEAAV
jgi:hypothetical protein